MSFWRDRERLLGLDPPGGEKKPEGKASKPAIDLEVKIPKDAEVEVTYLHSEQKDELKELGLSDKIPKYVKGREPFLIGIVRSSGDFLTAFPLPRDFGSVYEFINKRSDKEAMFNFKNKIREAIGLPPKLTSEG